MQRKEISITTKKKLQKLLTLTGVKELQLEFARQNLCKLEVFEPYASFQRLDRLCKGYLVAKDIIAFLRDNAIDITDEIEARLVIHYFDSTQTGKLLYSDYLQMLLPCDQPYLRAIATQRPTYPITQKEFLPFDVERALAKLVHKELKLAMRQEQVKQELNARYDFDLERLFREVDDWNYKYIDHKNLKRYLSKMGVAASDQSVIAVIRRFDLDADAKLNLKEFGQGIIPQVDFSKRYIKDRTHKPNVNNRELALSPGRGGRDHEGFGMETVNVHHSPLRSRPTSYKRGATAAAAVYTVKSTERDRSRSVGRSGKTQKKRKSTKSKSKSRTRGASANNKGGTHISNLQKEFQNFKRALETGNTIDERQQQNTHRDNTDFDSIATSPNQSKLVQMKAVTPRKDHKESITPQKMTPQNVLRQTSHLRGSAILSQKHQLLSPSSPYSSRKITHDNFRSEQSPLAQELSQIRAMRSPFKQDMARAEEGEASLIYLTRDAFKEILAIEGNLEKVKKELVLRHDFTLAGSFKRFSDNTHGRINSNDLLFGLEQMSISCDIADARLIVDRYDADKDGRLGFWEFSNALLPIQAGLRDDVEMRKAIWDISSETLELLKKTFRCIVDSEAMIEGIRQRIAREKSVQLRYAFDSLDWLGRGFLTQNEFKRSFEQISERLGQPQLHHEIVVKIKDSVEMEGMIRRFNKDKLNGRISLPEFLDELTPKCSEKPY